MINYFSDALPAVAPVRLQQRMMLNQGGQGRLQGQPGVVIAGGQDAFQLRFGTEEEDQAARLRALQDTAAQSRQTTNEVVGEAKQTHATGREVIKDVVETLTDGQNLLDEVKNQSKRT